MQLACASCLLRPLRLDDAEALARHANDRDVWLQLRDRFPHPYGRSDADAFISFVSDGVGPLVFGIEVDGEVKGTVGLEPRIDVERVSAEIGYWLGREVWGRGLATEAVRALTSHAFDALQFRRVFAVPFAHNVASVRVLEKAGFIREGVMRRSAIKEDVVCDQILYAAYDDRWPTDGLR